MAAMAVTNVIRKAINCSQTIPKERIISITFLLISLSFQIVQLHSLSSSAPSSKQLLLEYSSSHQSNFLLPHLLTGDWDGSKASLRKTDVCVVKIPGLGVHLKRLQTELGDNGPSDIDLRARIRINSSSSSSSSSSLTYKDCLQVRDSIISVSNNDETRHEHDPCAIALEELARGMASLAEGSMEGITDVFVRIVCASNYRARDPPFHTDKAPLRGYVTLQGVGTEFMTRTCSPFEYLTLRTLSDGKLKQDLEQAQELEFIVMKGDYYHDTMNSKLQTTNNDMSFLDKFWTRARACVHRSPTGNGERRVIVSFDLADGQDDREWYQVATKREWRNGLTQRKSHLVA
jgi:hypothetical protein